MRNVRDGNLLFVELGCVVAMAIWAIRAMFFSGAYSAHSDLPAGWFLVIDASRPERMLAILFGFVGPLFGVPILMALREWSDRTQSAFAHSCLHVAMTALGWYGFPYLGLGIRHAYACLEFVTSYDPSENPPGMFPLIGGVWYVTALIAPIAMLLAGICMGLIAAADWGAARRSARWAMALSTSICLILPLVMPHYFDWILD